MCDITGFLTQTDAGRSSAIASRMADTITHRGPDHSGVWVVEPAGLALAHRRLSILDLSPQGHQPMLSHCGRYVIAFNGRVFKTCFGHQHKT